MVASRLMEANAGFLAHADLQVGQVVRALEEIGELDDTIFVYIVGDNGASAEGGRARELELLRRDPRGPREHDRADLDRLDQIGGPQSYPHYPAGFAWALEHALPMGQDDRVAPRRDPQSARDPLAEGHARPRRAAEPVRRT